MFSYTRFLYKRNRPGARPDENRFATIQSDVFLQAFSTVITAIDLLTLRKQYAIMSPHRQRGLLAHERGLLSTRNASLPV